MPSIPVYGRRRALRIFPAYWLAFAAVLLFGLPAGASVSAGEVAVHGALLHNLVPGEQQAIYFASWTLTLEALFYCAVPVAAWVLARRRPAGWSARSLTVLVVATWIASVGFTATAPLVSDADRTLWLRLLFPSMASMFCPGILVAIGVHAARSGTAPRWFTAITDNRRASLVVLAILAVGGAIGATAVPLLVYDLSRQLFALASGIALVLAVTRGPLMVGGRALRSLGVVSYGIYLWQGVVIYVLERHPQLIPLRHTGTLAYAVHVAVLLGLTLPLAWASWHLVERPAIAASRRG